MDKIKKAAILGTGSYLPEKVLSNHILETMVDTSDEWIFTRTGIKERRLASKDEHTSYMGAEAAKKAIKNAGISKEDIDYIVFATAAPDYIFPSSAALAQAYLGLNEVPAFDCMTACTGFLYGLSIAKAFVEANLYRKVLVIASDKLSSFVNYKDRNTCILFGDGASAAVVGEAIEGSLEISNIELGADGSLGDLLKLPAGGSRLRATHATIEDHSHYITMEGKEVFKHAVRRMESSAKLCMDKAGLNESHLNWLVPHQANVRIIDAIAKRFAIDDKKVFKTLHKYGNTAASSIGIALDELLHEKDVVSNERLLLVAFGGGLSWGAAILHKI